MIESENHKNLQASAQKLERELRRSLNTFQGYIYALEEEQLDKKQKTFLQKLQNESDRMNRKLSAFGKVLDTELKFVDDNSKVFNTKETFESIIAMLKVDFPKVMFNLIVDPKIEATNQGESGIITDMIHGVAVLLLQHRSTKLTINLHISQITAGNQFVDVILEANDCSLNDQYLLSYLRFDEADVSDKNRFVSSLSF